MANPVCLSPLKFYDDASKQCHRKSYAFGHVSPLLTFFHIIPPFQFVLPDSISINSIYVRNLKDERVTGNVLSSFQEAGLTITEVSDFRVLCYPGNQLILSTLSEGQYYLEINLSNNVSYYSEVFCFENRTDNYLEIEYWNESGNFFLKDGVVSFENDFHFYILLETELGKPEYSFEEEVTKRLGYSFVESQVSKKTYKFNTLLPEFICDAMRIIRMCDNKIIRSKNDEYEAITFEVDTSWQNQGDLASVTCEFETDNVMVNIGGFKV